MTAGNASEPPVSCLTPDYDGKDGSDAEETVDKHVTLSREEEVMVWETNEEEEEEEEDSHDMLDDMAEMDDDDFEPESGPCAEELLQECTVEGCIDTLTGGLRCAHYDIPELIPTNSGVCYAMLLLRSLGDPGAIPLPLVSALQHTLFERIFPYLPSDDDELHPMHLSNILLRHLSDEQHARVLDELAADGAYTVASYYRGRDPRTYQALLTKHASEDPEENEHTFSLIVPNICRWKIHELLDIICQPAEVLRIGADTQLILIIDALYGEAWEEGFLRHAEFLNKPALLEKFAPRIRAILSCECRIHMNKILIPIAGRKRVRLMPHCVFCKPHEVEERNEKKRVGK
jgi:hypothetical protein